MAREFSEDKARQGESFSFFSSLPPCGCSFLSVMQTDNINTLYIYIGGSLGWKVRGSLHGDFEKVAYELEPSTTANPKYAEVKTSHGYHIIMVEGRK